MLLSLLPTSGDGEELLMLSVLEVEEGDGEEPPLFLNMQLQQVLPAEAHKEGNEVSTVVPNRPGGDMHGPASASAHADLPGTPLQRSLTAAPSLTVAQLLPPPPPHAGSPHTPTSPRPGTHSD